MRNAGKPFAARPQDPVPRALVLLALVDVGLIAAHLLFWAALRGRSNAVDSLTNLESESSVGTWWSVVQLLAAGVGFALVGLARHRCSGDRVARWFGVLAGALVVASMDELVQVHERFSVLATRLAGNGPFQDTGPWMLVLGPLALVVLAVLARQVAVALRDDRRAFGLLVAGGIAVVAGAAGAEIGRNWVDHNSAGWALQVAVEEGLELSGASMLVLAGLSACASGGVRLTLASAPNTAAELSSAGDSGFLDLTDGAVGSEASPAQADAVEPLVGSPIRAPSPDDR
ncbi:MAG: hypothetical protein OEY23_17165 [Acidimicrobiia bacterium]|nr:hypothetical protein [Acidimicrobiia bacterium]